MEQEKIAEKMRTQANPADEHHQHRQRCHTDQAAARTPVHPKKVDVEPIQECPAARKARLHLAAVFRIEIFGGHAVVGMHFLSRGPCRCGQGHPFRRQDDAPHAFTGGPAGEIVQP